MNVLAALLLLALSACGQRAVAPDAAVDGIGVDTHFDAPVLTDLPKRPIGPSDAIDVLIVMADVNSTPALELANFVRDIADELVRRRVDFHLAITSSGVRIPELCPDAWPGGLVVPTSSSRPPDWQGAWPPKERTITSLMQDASLRAYYYALVPFQGATPCAATQHLGAALGGLDTPGFSRSGAAAFVLIIGVTDDCTIADPEAWDPSLPWAKEYFTTARCVLEPPGTLQTTKALVAEFAKTRVDAPLRWALLGSSAQVELETIGGRKAIKPVCNGRVLPTPRLHSVAQATNSRGQVGLSAEVYESCHLFENPTKLRGQVVASMLQLVGK